MVLIEGIWKGSSSHGEGCKGSIQAQSCLCCTEWALERSLLNQGTWLSHYMWMLSLRSR